MKHLKTFEHKYLKSLKIKKHSSFEDTEDILDDCVYYLEHNVPVTGKEGFIECLYDADDYIYATNEYYHPIFIYFYFDVNIADDKLDLFYNFLNEYELTVSDNKYENKKIIIITSITEEKMIKLAEAYKTIKKYNL